MYVCLVGCVISGSYFSSHRQARQYLRSNTNYNICLMLCLFRFFCFPRFFFFFYIAPQSRSISFPHLVSDSPITLTETNGRKSRPFQKKRGDRKKNSKKARESEAIGKSKKDPWFLQDRTFFIRAKDNDESVDRETSSINMMTATRRGMPATVKPRLRRSPG